MTVIPDTPFDPDLLKKAVLTDRQAREFKKHAKPILVQDKTENVRVKGFMHADGRILLTEADPIPPRKPSQPGILTPEKPLFGNRCGKSNKTHWIVFMKGAAQ